MKTAAAFGALFALIPAIVLADECKDILVNSVNTSLSVSSSQRDEIDKNYYCSSTLDEAKSYYSKEQSSGGGGGGSVSYGIFQVSGSGNNSSIDSLTSSNFSLWQANNCGSQSKETHSSSYDYRAQSVVASDVVSAWKACMLQREGLICLIPPANDQISIFTFRWNKVSKVDPTLVMSYLVGGTSAYPSTPAGSLVPQNAPILNGIFEVPVSRNGSGEMIGGLQVAHDGNNYACHFAVPALPAPPPPPSHKISPSFTPMKGCLGTSCKPDDTFTLLVKSPSDVIKFGKLVATKSKPKGVK